MVCYLLFENIHVKKTFICEPAKDLGAETRLIALIK